MTISREQIEHTAREIERWIAAVALDGAMAGTASAKCCSLINNLATGEWTSAASKVCDHGAFRLQDGTCPVCAEKEEG